MSADPILAPGGARTAASHSTPDAADDQTPVLDRRARAAFAAVAEHLIPAAHGMPSAADVVGDRRLRFVLNARPDLREPFHAALRPGVGDGSGPGRLTALEAEPDTLAALLQVVVFAYYTDRDVRDRLGYPGQMAKTLYSWKVPDFIEEGLTEAVLARGPIWRDPATGRRVAAQGAAEAARAPEILGAQMAPETSGARETPAATGQARAARQAPGATESAASPDRGGDPR